MDDNNYQKKDNRVPIYNRLTANSRNRYRGFDSTQNKIRQVSVKMSSNVDRVADYLDSSNFDLASGT